VTVFVRRKGKTLLSLKDVKLNGANVTFEPRDSENDLEQGVTSATGALPGSWTIASGKKGEEGEEKGGGLDQEEIADILIAVQYKAAEKP
jgi:hypothetical protein